MEPILYRAIGVIRTPHLDPVGMPIQPVGARGIPGRVEVLPELAEGLTDIDGFSHLILIYHLHRVSGMRLTVEPFLDRATHGVFAVRSPQRPNPIGLSVVRLVSVEGNVLHVEGVDVLDGTPLLDIKPYVPAFDAPDVERVGWLEGRLEAADRTRADARFVGRQAEVPASAEPERPPIELVPPCEVEPTGSEG